MRFELTGWLDPCYLLSYVVPADRLRPLVPAELELETLGDFGLANLVISRIAALRPKSLPSFAGLAYWHVALRFHTKVVIRGGRRLHGLFFVRSFVSSRLIALVGNRLTGFKMVPAQFEIRREAAQFEVLIKDCARLRFWNSGQELLSTPVPPPFLSRDHMNQVLRYSPMSFDIVRAGNSVSITEVERDQAEWSESAVKAEGTEWSHSDLKVLSGAELVRATSVSPIKYRWRLGRIEQLDQSG